MPRDAHEQAAWVGVIAVDKEILEPGDLLFFGSEPGRITHTGMYMGNDEFIHATAHERPVIQISHLTDEHWMKLFLMARRIK
jgi:cell wall-associated NlpC family hydrolase